MWHELAPVDFEASIAEFFLPRDVYSPTREDMVLPIVRWLLNAGVVSSMDNGCPLRATYWPFITTQKVSPIFKLVHLNEGLHKEESFSFDGWEQISHNLAERPADRPLFCTHVHLKTALKRFTLP